MTKTYEIPDGKTIIADVDEKHHTATVTVYALDDLVEAVNKTGHWIPTYGNVKCSVCGSVKESRRVGKATHYCDFCGAKMIDPQERSEE